MKQILRNLSLCLSVLFLFSCNLITEKTTISFVLPYASSNESRAIDDDLSESSELEASEETDYKSLNFTLIISNEKEEITRTGKSGDTFTIELEPNTYTVQVYAVNNDETLKYKGEVQNIKVTKGSNTEVKVKLRKVVKEEIEDEEPEQKPSAEVFLVSPEIYETILIAGEASYNVKLTSTENTKIYFTLDGSNPTTESTEYTEDGEKGIEISEPATLKYFAVSENYKASDIYSLELKFKLPKVIINSEENPNASTTITMSAFEGAKIYYTTDGSFPTEASDEYNEPLTISENTTIKAVSMLTGYENSEVVEKEVTILAPSEIDFSFTVILGVETIEGSYSNEESAKAAVEQNAVSTALQKYAYPVKFYINNSTGGKYKYLITTSRDSSGKTTCIVNQINSKGIYEPTELKCSANYYYIFKSFEVINDVAVSKFEVRVDIQADLKFNKNENLFGYCYKSVPYDINKKIADMNNYYELVDELVNERDRFRNQK